ncbi:MAG TPA: 3'-5' exonuclease [Candidatus Paceibacterota bacterium]
MEYNSRDYTLHFIDTETTGLDPRMHEIISFGLVRAKHITDDVGNSRFEILDEREILLKPENLGNADPTALKINGYAPERWTGALSQIDGMNQIRDMLTELDEQDQKVNRVIIAGHNVQFDLAFIQGACWREDIKYHLPRHVFDTYSLSHHMLTLKSYSLARLCEHFNIVNKDAHSALSDARASLEVYKKLCQIR